MQISNREIAGGLVYSMAESKLPVTINILRKIQNAYAEVQPDEWDMKLLAHAAAENDGTAVSLEDLARDLGVEL